MSKLVILVGVPGSGKSTFGKEYANEHNLIVVSSDELRQTLFGDATNQEHNKVLFNIIDRIVDELLRDGLSVLLDATNLSVWSRKRFIQKAERYLVHASALVIHTSLETAKRRNAARERVVPDSVIERMYKGLEMPTTEEGFDEVIIINNDEDK